MGVNTDYSQHLFERWIGVSIAIGFAFEMMVIKIGGELVEGQFGYLDIICISINR